MPGEVPELNFSSLLGPLDAHFSVAGAFFQYMFSYRFCSGISGTDHSDDPLWKGGRGLLNVSTGPPQGGQAGGVKYISHAC